MAKVKTAYFCQSCGHQSPKWLGRCPSCGEWNTLVEEVLEKEDKKRALGAVEIGEFGLKPKAIVEIKYEEEPRIVTIDGELNRVLGGGIVLGSLVLIGGPGIGKSTLMLQIALTLTQRVLYVSGEESEQQIKMRAERLTSKNHNCFILTETSTDNIFRQIEEFNPDVLIIDSIRPCNRRSSNRVRATCRRCGSALRN